MTTIEELTFKLLVPNILSLLEDRIEHSSKNSLIYLKRKDVLMFDI